MSNSTDHFSQIYALIAEQDILKKCEGIESLHQRIVEDSALCKHLSESSVNPPIIIQTPGLPHQLELVAPKELNKRSIQSQPGRNVLMHAIAHIEFNAINLALDATYRFRRQPPKYYADWLGVAADEARHFGLVRNYLNEHGCDYTDYPAHNGLWDMAVHTQNDVVGRMALVPRVLEARGLDVSPKMIERLENAGDQKAADILRTIYNDEIGHVKIGSTWFRYQCEIRDLEPGPTFVNMIKTYLHGDIKGPFNVEARFQAGFDEIDIQNLQQLDPVTEKTGR